MGRGDTAILLLFLCALVFPGVVALSPSAVYIDQVRLLSNTYSCGDGIRCEAYVEFPGYVNRQLTGEDAPELDLDYLDGRASGYEIAFEIGHYEKQNVTVPTERCTTTTSRNGSVSSVCSLVNGTQERSVIVWHGQRILPGVNVLHLWSDAKPGSESVDWNFRIPVQSQDGSSILLDSRAKGWAIWGVGGANESSTSFSYYRTVTITSGVSTNLTDFPVYFILNTSTLVASGKLRGDCADLRVTNGTYLDTTVRLLDYEIEAGTCNTTATVVWVKLPSLPSSGTTLTVYYGNASATDRQNRTGVWSNGYLNVYHFGESAWSGAVVDSVGNNNGTYAGSGIKRTAGCRFGGCLDFAGANAANYVSLTTTSPSSVNNVMSIWYLYNTTAPAQTYQVTYASQSGEFYHYHYTPDNNTILDLGVARHYTGTKPVAPNDWNWLSQRVNITASGISNMNLNDSLGMANRTDAFDGSFANLYLGKNSHNDKTSGLLDEFRYSSTWRSDDWLRAEFGQTYAVSAEMNQSSVADESIGRSAILLGLNASEIAGAYTVSTDRLVRERLANGTQHEGRFDLYISSGNVRWVFNYDPTSTSEFPTFRNITPSLYVWQRANLTSGNITNDVSAFINTTI